MVASIHARVGVPLVAGLRVSLRSFISFRISFWRWRYFASVTCVGDGGATLRRGWAFGRILRIWMACIVARRTAARIGPRAIPRGCRRASSAHGPRGFELLGVRDVASCRHVRVVAYFLSSAVKPLASDVSYLIHVRSYEVGVDRAFVAREGANGANFPLSRRYAPRGSEPILWLVTGLCSSTAEAGIVA